MVAEILIFRYTSTVEIQGFHGEFFETMNVLFAWSGDLLNLGPAIYAIINTHQNRHISFYIATINSKLVSKYRKHFSARPIKNTKFYIETYKPQYLTPKIFQIGYDTYIRLLFPDAHPELERFLHLDGDALVVQNIDELYDYDLKNMSGIIVNDSCSRCEGFTSYFNAGIILFNSRKYVNEKFLKQGEDYLKWLNKNKPAWFNDQTVLNKLFEHSKITFPQEYNEYNLTKFCNKTKIVHFYQFEFCKPYNKKCKDKSYAAHKLWNCYYNYYKEQPLLWSESRNISICEEFIPK